jgi:hypothetical protein
MAHGKKDCQSLHETTVDSHLNLWTYSICFNMFAYLLKYIYYLLSYLEIRILRLPAIFFFLCGCRDCDVVKTKSTPCHFTEDLVGV